MSPDPTLTTILRAVDEAEIERSPASPQLITEKRMAEAARYGWAHYFNSRRDFSSDSARLDFDPRRSNHHPGNQQLIIEPECNPMRLPVMQGDLHVPDRMAHS
jgi:hypothetical protein